MLLQSQEVQHLCAVLYIGAHSGCSAATEQGPACTACLSESHPARTRPQYEVSYKQSCALLSADTWYDCSGSKKSCVYLSSASP